MTAATWSLAIFKFHWTFLPTICNVSMAFFTARRAYARFKHSFFSQAGDQIVDATSKRNILIAPHIAEQFIAADDLARARAHVPQHFNFALAERDFLLISLSAIAIEIDSQRTQNERIIARMDAAQDGVNAGEQLVERKWFCDVVVGAERQTLDFVFFLASCRENDDCGAGLLCGQPAAYFESIQAGQRQVQQDKIRFESLALPERAAQLKLRVDGSQEHTKRQVMIMLTVQTMNVVHSGYHRITL